MDISVKHLPNSPGVYLFKDPQGVIIYIGKAKELKKRVGSYFQKQTSDWKVKALIDEHASIDYIPTENEIDALLLEAQLIQERKPKFNVLLKSGQPFVYVQFTKGPVPELKIVRNKKEKGIFFGPFLHKKQARTAVEYIERTFKLYRCKQNIPNGCLKFHLNLCAGSCMPHFDLNAYIFRINLAIEMLKGNYQNSLSMITEQVKEYTHALEFEKAQHLVFYLKNLETIFSTLQSRFSEKKYESSCSSLASDEKSYKHYLQTAQELQHLIGIKGTPITIDCFDISHFQSSALVGSCVRFTNGKPDKDKFRRFKIQSLDQQNDYAALQEIVQRRYKNPDNIPDLIVIDGGKGQLNAVLAIMGTIPCIALAKREETLFLPNKIDGIVLDVQTPVGKLIVELRDYTHHFAITYHRKRRHADFEEQRYETRTAHQRNDRSD
jgi:excinuclease ABC subunit C